MSLKRWAGFCVVSLVFIPVVLLGAHGSWAAEKKALSWGTTATTSGLFPFFVVTAKILNEKIPEINMTVRSTGSGVHNARLLEKREVDIGACDTSLFAEALQGKGPFEGKPFPDLRLLFVKMTNPLQFVVSEKSAIKDIYGLEGKAFTPGMLGSTAEMSAMGIFRLLGVHPKIRHASYADALETMKNEMIVGFAKFGVRIPRFWISPRP